MGRFFVIGIAFILVFFTKINYSFAQTEKTVLPVPLVSQHLSTADVDGNNGITDCASADVAMVLHYLAKTNTSFFAPDYTTIRTTLRSSPRSSQLSEGVDFRDIVTVTPHLTGGTLRAKITRTNSKYWKLFIKTKLEKGYPFIVYLNDWSYLPNHRAAEPTPHAITITGIDEENVYYNDSWDTQIHSSSFEEFQTAWSQSEKSFYALTFQKV